MELGSAGEEGHDSESEFFEVEEIFTPMSSESQDRKADLNTFIVEERLLDDKNKDCTLRNGALRWDLESEESELDSPKEVIPFDEGSHKQHSEADSDVSTAASKSIVVIDGSQAQDVKVEIELKSAELKQVSSSSTKPKQPNKNKWQEITEKTITQQRVISRWVPRPKRTVPESPKPKVPVYKWVAKGAAPEPEES